TPGGKWLAACVGKQLLFLGAADGARAGSVALPDGWTGVHLAAHPSGKAVAVALGNPHSDLLLGVWDLATGRLTDSLVQTYHLSQRKLTPGLQWAGQRRLFCGNSLIDLDRHVILCDRFVPMGQTASSGRTTPDGREWLVRTFNNEEWAKVEKKLARPPSPATR